LDIIKYICLKMT